MPIYILTLVRQYFYGHSSDWEKQRLLAKGFDKVNKSVVIDTKL